MRNYRVVATQVGDLLKYDTTVNEIRRIGAALFPFPRETFPNDAITSQRAQLIYDWVLSLAKHRMNPDERDALLVRFCYDLTPDRLRKDVDKVLRVAGIRQGVLATEDSDWFFARDFHPTVIKHCKDLFLQGNYFHAVFEAAKAYNRLVQQKARSDLSGQALMLKVWGCEKGVLKITPCQSVTDKDVQDGMKFLSAGLMGAIRNPMGHEPALDWPIAKQDCLDILSFISFLLRKLDHAVYYPAQD